MSDAKTCPSCGHPNSADARFCGKCGTPLAAPAPAVAPAPAPAARPPAASRTMLGALMDPSAEKPAEPAAPAPRQPFRTMLGGGIDPSALPPIAQSPPMAPAVAAVPQASSTMGLSASPMSAAPAPPAAPAPAAPVAPAPTAPAASAPAAFAPAPAPASFAPAPAAPAPAAFAPAPAAPAPVAPMAAPAPATPAAAPARAKEGLKTMIGVGLNPVPPAAPIAAAPAPAAPAAPIAAAPAAPPTPLATLTAAVPPPAEPAPSMADTFVDPPRPAPAAAPHRTMLGMPAPTSDPSAAAAASAALAAMAPPAGPAPLAIPPTAAAAPTAAPAEVAPAALPKRALGPSNRTMLGVAAPVTASPGVRAESAPPAAPAAPVAPYGPPAARPVDTTGDVSIAGMPSPRRRLRGWLIALLVLGVLLVGSVIAAALYYRMTRSRVDVAAAVSAGASGEVLAVDVLRAPEGTHARYLGSDQTLTGTHVEFPLAADALHVGDNAVAIDVVFPDGTTETHSVTLTVEYRVRADLASLAATPPAVTVVVDALAGSTVVLDATPLTLDGSGHGTRAYPIDAITADATGTRVLTAHYTITPPAPASPASGTLTSRIPSTTLRLERPGDRATTDRATITIGGVTQAGAAVTVDGVAATVSSDGHFTFDAPLVAVGARELHVVASLAGRAPTGVTLHVERVPDLARAAAGYAVDRTLTYARIAADPAAVQGQHVAVEGRVYNVDLQDGHGVLQMLARDCPAGQRCPLWVTHPAVSEVAVESWVRVVGTVAGSQEFVSQSGEHRTVPRVDAVYVLPSHP